MVILCIVAIAIVIATVSTSRGDGDTSTSSGGDTGEPTAPAVMPFKGSEQPMKDPFTPHDVGDPNGVWKYEDLTADEKATADQGLNEDQAGVQDVYALASRDSAARAQSESAAVQLGLDIPLGEVGVEP